MDSPSDVAWEDDGSLFVALNSSFGGVKFDLSSDNYNYRKDIREWYEQVFQNEFRSNRDAMLCSENLVKLMYLQMSEPCQAIIHYAEAHGRIQMQIADGKPFDMHEKIKKVNEMLDIVAKDSLRDRAGRLKEMRDEIHNCRRHKFESISQFALRFTMMAHLYMNYARLDENPRVRLELIWTMLENADLDADVYKRIVSAFSRKATEKPVTATTTVKSDQLKKISELSTAQSSAVTELKNLINSGTHFSRKDLTDKIATVEKISKELGYAVTRIPISEPKYDEKTEFNISLEHAMLTFFNSKTTSANTSQEYTKFDGVEDVFKEARNVPITNEEELMNIWIKVVSTEDGAVDQTTRTRFVQLMK